MERENPTNAPKTIQLAIHPGFWTPQWVINNLTNCDPMSFFRLAPP
jgi:hypothetical protein